MNALGYDRCEGYGSARRLNAMWASVQKTERSEVGSALKKAGLSTQDVMAEALDSKIDSFERVDRTLASAEARRSTAPREIDRRRQALGARVRQAVVQDAEFRDVETGEQRLP
jgi:hypothetical protein